MSSKIIFSLIFLFLFTAIQYGLTSNINWLNSFFIIIVFILYLFIDKYDKNMWWIALTTGIIVDLFSPLPLGIFTLALFFTLFIINFLRKNFLTNKSIYTVVYLGTIGMIIYKLLFYSIRSLEIFEASAYIKPVFSEINFLIGLIMEIVLFITLFWFGHVFTKK